MKVISYSLYGERKEPKLKYFVGMIENLKLAPDIYPGWVVRVYLDERHVEWAKENLEPYNPQIIVMPQCDDSRGMFWRFRVFFDNTITHFLCRDSDSRLNRREAHAIGIWLKSKYPVVLMRDHQKYHNVRMLPGMMGGVPNFLPGIEGSMEAFLRDHGNWGWGADIRWMHSTMWMQIKNNHLCFDDCRRYTRRERRFNAHLPQGQFVGQCWTSDNQPVYV